MNFAEVSQWIIKGGPIMWPIILGSIVGFAVILQKVIVFSLWKQTEKKNNFSSNLVSKIEEKNYDEALQLCQSTGTPLGRIMSKGLQKRNLDRKALEEVLEKEAQREVKEAEKGMGLLLTIVGVEPMMGFLGTIIGLIKAFKAWEELGNAVTVSNLSGGMYQAMITTAAGLIVAIPLYLCYNWISNNIKLMIHDWHEVGETFLENHSQEIGGKK
ncbi:MAG: MotA/TolQ/ExbB proton channel family protein [Elusimicrobia bacterium]|nr:MotA/TolQ/ExbB proton channel family protein [Elusimicrobiota bacterium]